MLAIANSIRLFAMILLAVSVGMDFITLPLLLLTTFLFGVGEVMYDTTMQSMLPEVLEVHQLEKGNARLQVTSVTLGEFIGTPLGGFLFAISIALPFFLGVFGIVVAISLVLFIPRNYSVHSPSEAKEKTGFWEDIRFGIKYLYKSKRLLRLVLMTSAMSFFYAVTGSTMVLFILETLQTPPALLGVIIATPAIGALLGSFIAHRLSERFGRMRVMAWAMVLSAVVTVLMGLSPNYWTLALLLTISSLIVTNWNILLMATYHQIIPTHLFGRIHGTRRTLVWGSLPFGSLLGGVIAGLDLRLPFIVGGLFCLLISALGYRFIVGLGDMLGVKD
jgi:MFS family permease